MYAPHHTTLGKIQYHTPGKYQTLPSMFPFVAGVIAWTEMHTSLEMKTEETQEMEERQ